jgi:hypothetical protein
MSPENKSIGKKKPGKKMSKGNVWDFIEDANRSTRLYNQMMDIIRTRGEGYTANSLMEKFHSLGYENVSLLDAKRIINTVKKLKDPEGWDWHY